MVGFRDLPQVYLVGRSASYVIPAIFVIELIGLMRIKCNL